VAKSRIIDPLPQTVLPARISILILAAAQAAWCQPVDSTVCAGCHRQIAESYARTGMGRSFYSAAASVQLPEFRAPGFFHRGSQEQFTPVQRDGQYYIRRSQLGPDGKPANVREVRVDYVMGSGNHARSYLHKTPDNRLIEFPVSWYPEQGGVWRMSPGYDLPNHAGFSREVSLRCVFCHNAYPESDEVPAGLDGAEILPARLPEGIDCQRCHGPGGAHVRAVQSGQGAETIRAAIVNPARLSPERRIEVCLQCHLESTTMQLPATIMRPDRTVFSYRPGEPLSDYILHFDFAPGSGRQKRFDLVSAGYRLLKSACFRASSGRLTCTTCHNPHQAASSAETRQRANRECQGCHQGAIARLVVRGGHPAATACTGCHMPPRRADDAIHMTVTDHAIVRRPAGPQSVPAIEANDAGAVPYAGEVVLNYPKELPATPDNTIALAMAQVRDLSNLPAGLERLGKAIADFRPVAAESYYRMAAALLNTGQTVKALPLFQEAARREPANSRYRDALAKAFLAAGQTDQAVSAAQQAKAFAPADTGVLSTLGLAYAGSNRLGEASAVFRMAAAINPENAGPFNSLGSLLLRTGHFGGAEEALLEAVRLQPEDASARMNLADALLEQGKSREAKYELQQAIRSGPSIQTARGEWFSALAATGNLKIARERYDASLRGQMADAHNTLGSILMAQGDAVAAVREHRQAVTGDPSSADFLANLGFALAASGNPAEARQRLAAAVRTKPDLFEAHLKLAELLLAAGQPAQAELHLKRAAESPDARTRQAAATLRRR
jgi:predicted CXXCH cytochrome family protein